MADGMNERELLALMRTVRVNLGAPIALEAVADIADEVRRLKAALEQAETREAKLRADLERALALAEKRAGPAAVAARGKSSKHRNRVES